MSRRRKPQVGDVLQFSLPNDSFAYGRVLNDSAVAFYSARSSQAGQPPIGDTNFEFTVVVYSDVLRSDAAPVVGFDPRPFNDDDWPPPGAITDALSGAKRIYDHGQVRPAHGEEWVGLEPVAVWDLNHVIDRLMGNGDRWLRSIERAGPPQGPHS